MANFKGLTCALVVLCLSMVICSAEPPRFQRGRGVQRRLQPLVAAKRQRIVFARQEADAAPAPAPAPASGPAPYPSADALKPEIPFEAEEVVTAQPDQTYGPPEQAYGPPAETPEQAPEQAYGPPEQAAEQTPDQAYGPPEVDNAVEQLPTEEPQDFDENPDAEEFTTDAPTTAVVSNAVDVPARFQTQQQRQKQQVARRPVVAKNARQINRRSRPTAALRAQRLEAIPVFVSVPEAQHFRLLNSQQPFAYTAQLQAW